MRARCVLLMAAALAACSEPAVVTTPNTRIVDGISPAPGTTFEEGASMEVGLRVMDWNRRPLAGVPVRFYVSEGGGSVSPATGVTDAAGEARTTFTLGPAAGEHQMWMAAEGAAEASFTVLLTPLLLRLTPDAVALSGVGAMREVGAAVTRGGGPQLTGIEATWSEIDPGGVISLHTPDTTFIWRGLRRLIQAEAPGTARVVATYRGSADTVTVTVAQP